MAGLAVAARAVPAADGLAGGCRDRCGAAQVRPGGLAAQPFRGAGPDPVEGEKPGGAGGGEGADELAGAFELPAGELRASAQLAQRDAGGVADGAAGPGAQRGQPGDQGSRGVPGEAGPQIIGSGQDQGPGLAAGLGPFACGAAPVGRQRADRPGRAVPAPGRAAGPAGLGGAGSADGVERGRTCPGGGGPAGRNGRPPRPGRQPW
jgi:hypothetical protein